MLQPNSNLQKAITAGFSMAGSLLVCGGISYIIANKYDNPLFLMIGLFIGAFIGLYEIYRQIKK